MIIRPTGIYLDDGTRHNYTMLDNLIDGPVKLLDIDMYGSEIDALKGAAKTIIMYRPELLITLHEDRIMKERERIIGLLSDIFELPIDITDEGDKLHVKIADPDLVTSYFRGHSFQYHRQLGAPNGSVCDDSEPIMYFDGWTTEVKLREKCLKDNDVVYDLGAHIGSWTIPAALICKHVYAWEPNIDCTKILRANLSLNKLDDRVTIHNAGLGGGINSCFNGNNTIVTARLDEYDAIMPPNFIKIDVEGAELDVIKGAQETIKRYKPRMLIEVHNLGSDIIDGCVVGGHNTYDDVMKAVMKLVPSYNTEVDKGTYCIFTP